MARIPGFALLGALLLIAACRAELASDASVVLEDATAAPTSLPASSSPVEPTPFASPSPTPTPLPEAALPAVPRGIEPLAARFPTAAALIEEAPERVAVAVLTSDGGTYEGGDDGTFALASVAKLPIMIATFEHARLEGRSLTVEERALVRRMIVLSDNNATDALWQALGRGVGVAALLEPLGLTGIEYASDHQWGDSRATPLVIATLLDQLLDEASPLSADAQVEALELMRSVAADQRWGASAGVDLSTGGPATLAIKNGWYPEPGGWLLNSAGAIEVQDRSGGSSVHIVVVLTEGARTQTEGVGRIESIASAINHTIVPPALVVTTQPRVFAVAPPPADAPAAVEPDVEPDVEPEPAEESTPTITLVVFEQSDDVLVPADGALVGSTADGSELTLWYEVGSATADELLATYAVSMFEFGWLEVVGPPSMVLSKSAEGRWVGLSTFPAGGGARLVQVTISPAPSVSPAAAGSPE